MDGADIILLSLGVLLFALITVLFVFVVLIIRSRRADRIAKANASATEKEVGLEVNNNNNKAATITESSMNFAAETAKRLNRTCVAYRTTEIRLPCIRTLRDGYNNIGNTEIPMKEFVQRLSERREHDFDWFDREFEVLNRSLLSERKSMVQSVDSMKKNRFMDVLPYEDNRVKIENHGNDYINASFIDGYDIPRHYIATQGPIGYNEANQGKRESTVEDFWMMLWEQSVHCVVMLTECIENLRLKCAQYWPEKVDTVSIYGKVKVRLVTSLCDGICTQREMSVSYEGHTRTVRQWHYKEWQDCKGPQDAKHLIDFIRRVRRSSPQPPILVHCSAGIGRTGVFIALDILLQHIMHHSTVDIFGCVKKLREQRVRMVQTIEQYITLYDTVGLAIQESALSENSVTPRSVDSLEGYATGNNFTQIAISA